MIVLTLNKCPPGLKGNITKWLLEVNTGVYVGKLSSRVRELLWERVCKYCGTGEATMIFSARNEQGYSFYVYNTSWNPIDFDGRVLLKKPLPIKEEKSKQRNTTKKKNTCINLPTLIQNKTRQEKPIDISALILSRKILAPLDFVAIDLETTGLKSDQDNIIEIGAVKYRNGEPVDQYHALVKYEKSVPDNIVDLTGIKNELLEKYGLPIEKAINGILDFIGDDILVGHYISFDLLFLRKACSRFNISFKQYKAIDTVALAKEFCKEYVESFKLATLVKKLDISENQEHRALPDAVLAAKLYLKLNKIM